MKLLIKFLVVCWLFIAPYVMAVEIKDLFEVEVLAQSQSREDRNTALREALAVVLNRVMVGDDITQDSTVKAALDNASSYVDQYQYGLNTQASAKDKSRIMRVAFNEDVLMGLMRSSQLSIWNEVRDQVLVWVVVEAHGKRSLLEIEQNRLVGQALQKAAKLKGVPVLMPLMDLEEKQKVLVADVLSAYPTRLMKASERYDVAAILSGKLVKKRRCWQSEWTLSFDEKIEQWTVPCSSLDANLAESFQGVYKPLSTYYSAKSGRIESNQELIKISGIKGMTAETNIKAYLRNLPMVSDVKWIQVDQGRHVFELKFSGTREALHKYITVGRELREKGMDAQDGSRVYELLVQ